MITKNISSFKYFLSHGFNFIESFGHFFVDKIFIIIVSNLFGKAKKEIYIWLSTFHELFDAFKQLGGFVTKEFSFSLNFKLKN